MKTPEITPKQLEILLLIHRFRFLDRSHIQRFLNHKDPRRINKWLKDMANKGILGRQYSRTIGENIKPAIYYLETKSRNVLKNNDEVNAKLLNRVYRERTRSRKFIDHNILVANVYFYLRSQYQNKDTTLYFYTKVDLSLIEYLPHPTPDAYIAIKNPKGTKRYFLEIMDLDTPRFVMRRLIERYMEYYECQKWQENTDSTFPLILIACPSKVIQKYLTKHIEKTLEDAYDDITFIPVNFEKGSFII